MRNETQRLIVGTTLAALTVTAGVAAPQIGTTLYAYANTATALPDVAEGTVALYVDATLGSDANDGLTAGTAFQSLDKAISYANANNNKKYSFVVASGTYNNNGQIVVGSSKTIVQITITGNVVIQRSGGSNSDMLRVENGGIVTTHADAKLTLDGAGVSNRGLILVNSTPLQAGNYVVRNFASKDLAASGDNTTLNPSLSFAGTDSQDVNLTLESNKIRHFGRTCTRRSIKTAA